MGIHSCVLPAVGGVATAVNYGTYVILIHNFDNLIRRLRMCWPFALASPAILSCQVILHSESNRPGPGGQVPDGTFDQSFQRVGAARDMALGRGAETLCPAVCLCGRFPCQLLYGAIRLAPGSHTLLLKRKSRSQLRESVLGPYVLFIQCRRFTYRCSILCRLIINSLWTKR